MQPGHADQPGASVKVEPGGDSCTITISGRLDAASVSHAWRAIFDPLKSGPARNITVQASGLNYCDGAGLGLLVEIDRAARRASGHARFDGLSDDLRRLLDRALLPDAGAVAAPRRRSLVTEVGRNTVGILGDLRQVIAFLGEVTAAFAWAATHPRKVRFRDVLLVAEKAGADAVPVVCLLGFLMGVIISFQSADPLRQLGVDSMIPTLLAISMVRELGPLVTAIILAGRSGSAFAAELGTMKVTEEINALTTFGLDPVRFLVIPRLLASMFMTPLLSLFGTLFGLVGGYVIMLTLGYGLPFYVKEVTAAVDYVDLLQGLAKSVVFAFLITAIGCVRGLQTASGPGAVGDSTTRAVVAGIVLVVAADGILGVVFFYLHI